MTSSALFTAALALPLLRALVSERVSRLIPAPAR